MSVDSATIPAADEPTPVVPIDRLRAREPLKPILIGDQMSDMLRDAIISMQFKPGKRLVVRELEEWSGVSRATIRESLRQLAAEGLVKVVPQKGAVVATPTKEEAAEIYEIRAMLEGLIAQQFVERATAAQKKELRTALEAMRALTLSGAETSVKLEGKNAYYEVLFDGAQNSTVRGVLSGFQARITVLRATTLAQPGRSDAVISELERVVEAVEAGDADAAREAATAHVLAASATALEVLKSI